MTKYVDDVAMEYMIQQLKAKLKIAETAYNYTTETDGTVSFTVPSYTDDGLSTLEMYINDLRCIPTVDYTISGTTVTLTHPLTAGQNVYVIVKNITF